MNEFLKKRIDRKLETLSDERLYQVLDYIEFLESRYAEQEPASPSAFQKLAETVEDTLRASRVSAAAIKGTMDAMSAAGRMMSGLAAAGKAVVNGVSGETPAQPKEPKDAKPQAAAQPPSPPPENSAGQG
jgi:hypothetical protein